MISPTLGSNKSYEISIFLPTIYFFRKRFLISGDWEAHSYLGGWKNRRDGRGDRSGGRWQAGGEEEVEGEVGRGGPLEQVGSPAQKPPRHPAATRKPGGPPSLPVASSRHFTPRTVSPTLLPLIK